MVSGSVRVLTYAEAIAEALRKRFDFGTANVIQIRLLCADVTLGNIIMVDQRKFAYTTAGHILIIGRRAAYTHTQQAGMLHPE